MQFKVIIRPAETVGQTIQRPGPFQSDWLWIIDDARNLTAPVNRC
jgi:hypothetical protein